MSNERTAYDRPAMFPISIPNVQSLIENAWPGFTPLSNSGAAGGVAAPPSPGRVAAGFALIVRVFSSSLNVPTKSRPAQAVPLAVTVISCAGGGGGGGPASSPQPGSTIAFAVAPEAGSEP